MLQIEMRPLDQIRPYPGNPRVNDKAVDAVAKSIHAYGWRAPIVVDGDGVVVCGHSRLKAARKLGLAEAPVHVANDLSPEQVRAYRLADNRSGENASWDYDLLPVELSALQVANYDLSIIGFSGEELTRYLKPDERTGGADGVDPDEAPAPPADPVSKRGEAYQLGWHRVLCGDSRSPKDMARLAGMADNGGIDLCFTSPPYLAQRTYGEAAELVGDWEGLMSGVFGALTPPMKPDGQIIVNLGMIHRDHEWLPYWNPWIEFMRGQGWKRHGLYVWNQLSGLPMKSRGRLSPSFELIFHFCKQIRETNKTIPCKTAGQAYGDKILRNPDGSHAAISKTHAGGKVNDWKIPEAVVSVARATGSKARDGYDHPAAFPWKLPVEFINAFTQPGESVLDPFCGSGSTIIACHHTGRRGFGMEIDPAYCDVIRQRWAWQQHGRNCDWANLTPVAE
ncbi:MAG: DNA modification methylase [Planctomycetes bacterium]|nr:DNA modification methylase [Planctomycetota bacterium]